MLDSSKTKIDLRKKNKRGPHSIIISDNEMARLAAAPFRRGMIIDGGDGRRFYEDQARNLSAQVIPLLVKGIVSVADVVPVLVPEKDILAEHRKDLPRLDWDNDVYYKRLFSLDKPALGDEKPATLSEAEEDALIMRWFFRDVDRYVLMDGDLTESYTAWRDARNSNSHDGSQSEGDNLHNMAESGQGYYCFDFGKARSFFWDTNCKYTTKDSGKEIRTINEAFLLNHVPTIDDPSRLFSKLDALQQRFSPTRDDVTGTRFIKAIERKVGAPIKSWFYIHADMECPQTDDAWAELLRKTFLHRAQSLRAAILEKRAVIHR